MKEIAVSPENIAGHDEREERVDQLVTVDDAAQRLSCTPAAVRRWLSERRIERIKVGRLTRIRASDIADVIAHGLPERGSLRTRRGVEAVARR